jgi:hypothetical protein
VLPSGLKKRVQRDKCDQGRCVDGGVFVLSSGRNKEVSFGYCYLEVSNVFGLYSLAQREEFEHGRLFVLSLGRKKEVSFRKYYSEFFNVFGLDA